MSSSESHTAVELLSPEQEDLQGIRMKQAILSSIFSVAKHRADKRNFGLLFSRMNDPVVCNKRKLSDLGGMIKM